MTKRMVIDGESVGLHGEVFAIGWVVLNESGKEIGYGYAICPPENAAHGVEGDREWINENVMPTLHGFPIRCTTPEAVRDVFWAAYQRLKADGPVELWADCPWPVEAAFLISCADDNREERNWEGPYPLLDVGVMMRASGIDAMVTHPRLPDESPAHNPVYDARQSARLLLEAEARLASRQ